jgi:hypothetical protein
VGQQKENSFALRLSRKQMDIKYNHRNKDNDVGYDLGEVDWLLEK